jgi:urease accessory protein
MQLVFQPLETADPALRRVILRAARRQLAKRLWRGAAEDGTEFGFELERPLQHGTTFFATTEVRYEIEQESEPVLAISLAITPTAAAGIGWAVGNLHLELAGEPTRLLTPDEPAARHLLQRLQVPFQATRAIFRPGRFNRGVQSAHELGSSHRH